eukprot:TRINITY_DN5940_c0_g1_i1.p1 TRINITY_DN5940_c0_g1~~TRINITY_DN5940_c0_g1_i1.p1  ORF type:complete len:192 (+),score=18.44 TRINITY_DN5940_c0_g1_i1:134-709(+)
MNQGHYPAKLWAHIQPLSDNQASFQEAANEWEFDFEDHIKHDGVNCPCGHVNIHILCNIRNPKTLQTAIVGNECIKWFGEHLKAVADIARHLTSIQGTYVGPTKKGYQLQFQVNGNHSVVKQRQIIEGYFGKASAYGREGRWCIAVYDEREMKNELVEGAKYTLNIIPRNSRSTSAVKSFVMEMHSAQLEQ